MDFPANPAAPDRAAAAGLAKALGVEPLEVWAARVLMAILADEAAVRALTPDLAAHQDDIAGGDATGVATSASARSPPRLAYDVVSRFFAPGLGHPGGSDHRLAPLRADAALRQETGPAATAFHQAYPGRGGDLVCELAASGC